jgi:predicted Zn finger-like uncharacterized protein
MVSPLRAACPACKSKLKLRDSKLVGKRIRCPKCKEPMLVELLDDSKPVGTKDANASKETASTTDSDKNDDEYGEDLVVRVRIWQYRSRPSHSA